LNIFTIRGKPGSKDEQSLLIGIGLSDENLERLRSNNPIFHKGSDYDLPMDLFIYWATNESEMIEKLRNMGFEIPDGPPDGIMKNGGMTWSMKLGEQE
jgi:hypothetical protein